MQHLAKSAQMKFPLGTDTTRKRLIATYATAGCFKSKMPAVSSDGAPWAYRRRIGAGAPGISVLAPAGQGSRRQGYLERGREIWAKLIPGGLKCRTPGIS